MNTPEKIVRTYLRLNGFFTLPHFTVLSSRPREVDFLAVRVGGSKERIPQVDKIAEIDEKFLKRLNVSRQETVGLVIEVKGGGKEAEFDDEKYEYVKPFFGDIKPRKVGFEKGSDEFREGDGIVIVPLNHCIEFIRERIGKLSKISSKEGRGLYPRNFFPILSI